ncbi:S8 family serine peptidase [Hyalangium sp.]|uniref:S8 family serine peptidase n=1 Tax=Hyalangium sp. TaxID=2028555 RepID=UPI002D466BC6|nr:S8 family serine peptidase [Hyalangium sp.]HYH94509.1 S8 family serine peptidase [Hyalangium sp.]
MVLGPALALQGCTKQEEPQTSIAPAANQARAASSLKTLRAENGAEFVKGELLVRFKKDAGVMALAAHKLAGARVLHTYRSQPELQLVSVDESAMQEAITAYQKDPNVEYVEPNFVYSINGTTPNDARFGELWGLDNTGQANGVADADINAPEAWDLTTGSNTAGVITVIDTGVDYNHPDLTANMWTNPGEIAGNNLDDDGNGYVDDIHGINAITNSGNPLDDHDHGSHVSGTIAGRADNGIGVAGVNWTAQIMGCKFLDAAGSGTTANAIKCLDYVHVLKTRTSHPVNIIATSNSWGGGAFSQALMDGIVQHRNDGILFVAAAGNDSANNDTTTHYPSSYFLSNVIGVAAHDRSNSLASFSSYGRRNVHLSAPGVAVLSTVAGGGYAAFDGTSMATPHVSGVVGLLHAQNPGRDWRQLKNLVLAGGKTAAHATGKTLTGKRLRAADSDGQGALTCNNQTFATRVRPVADTVTANIYDQVQLIAYNVNCDSPVGSATVTVAPSGESFNLTDSGQYGDEVPGDGMYTGFFEPTVPGTYTLTFPGGDTLTVNVALPGAAYVKSAVPMVWRTITGTSLALTDELEANFTSPFPIPFAGGTARTTVRVGMNGGITFETAANVSLTNAVLPTTTHTTIIAPWWDDLYPGPTASTDNVFWAVAGTAPNRELVVEWRNVHHYQTRTGSPANTLNFQVVFFEGSSDVLFNYRDTVVGNATYNGGAGATVGVQSSSTVATQHSFNTASLADNTAYLWTIPVPSQAPVVDTLAVNPATITEGDTLTVEATFSDPDGVTDGPWKVEIDADYPGWFTADVTQDAASQGTVSGSAVVRVSGDVTVAARVQDKGRTRSTLKQTQVTVADVAPTLAAVTTSGPAGERQNVTLSTSFTDPGLDSPWKVEWDFNYDGATFSPDASSVAATAGTVTTVYAFPSDGEYTVAARVVDKDGVTSNLQLVQISIADLRPTLTGIAGNSSLTEGSSYDLSSSFINPGDNSRPWKVQWDFNYDGANFEVEEEEERSADGEIVLSRFARDSGSLQYALRVVDADGSISEVKTINMAIEEANPILSPLALQVLAGGSNEPSTVQFDLSANSGAEESSADPIRAFLWDFDGDGSYEYASTSPYAIYTYRDNAAGGSFTARVRVIDEDTSSEESIAVTINNVAPTLLLPGPQSAYAGTPLALRLTARDPGADVLTFTASGAPSGVTVSADGLLLWTPTRKQASRQGRQYTLNITVDDGDNASDTQALTLVAKWVDADNDGMEDSWEQENGLDPTQDDAMGDRNGDGINNGAEFSREFEGLQLPAIATAEGPLSGTLVKGTQVVLTTQNVADRGDLATVKYDFQLFSDAALVSSVCALTVDESATGGTTSATLPSGPCTGVTLTDDHVYSWRVRATDGDKIQGPWSTAQHVKVSTENDAPGTARASQPMPGSHIAAASPALIVDNALDVDDTQLTYTFELATDAALTQDKLTSDTLAGGASGSTSWTVSAALKPFTQYFWRVTVKDSGNLQSVTEVASFTYLGRPSNREPGLPEAVEPAAQGTVSTLTPTLVVKAATDADGDALQYAFEVDTSPTFTSTARKQSSALKAEQDGMVRWQTEGLDEDKQYWWRARATDPYSASDWVVGSFKVNAQNNAPSSPLALNPSDAIIFTQTPTLILQTAVDPEGDAITYVFEVKSSDGATVTSGEVTTAANSSSNQVSFKVTKELEVGAEYIWSARAKDAAGAVSAASADARFQVYKEPVIPGPAEDSGGCSTGAGALGGLLPLLAMALGMFRRRRSQA